MEKKWVIVFLIYADFRTNEAFPMSEEMKIEINSLLGDILTTPINDKKVRIFVIFNRIKFQLQGVEIKTESKTILYEVGNPQNKTENEIVQCQLIPGTSQLQTVSQLTEIFKKINVGDEEVLLITWDHGSAFGIFRDTEPRTPVVRNQMNDDLVKVPFLKKFWDTVWEKPEFQEFYKMRDESFSYNTIQKGHDLYKIPAQDIDAKVFIEFLKNPETQNLVHFIETDDGGTKMRLSSLKGDNKNQEKAIAFFSEETQKFISENREEKAAIDIPLDNSQVAEILKNGELAETIKAWLGQKKVGVLLMMNCWMMNLHTMYSMKDAVERLVAPQGDIACPGYNYKSIISYITDPQYPLISFDELAIKCVETCEDDFAKKRAAVLNPKHPDTIDSWKIISVDLQKKDSTGETLLVKHLEALRDLITVLNKHIITEKGIEIKYMLKYVRSVCFDFTNNDCPLVDIVNWFLSIKHADTHCPKRPVLNNEIMSSLIKTRDLIMSKADKPANVLIMSGGKRVYPAMENTLTPTAIISLPPRGYSLFFPEFDFSKNINVADNVKSDSLINGLLDNWKVFLHEINNKVVF